MGLTPERHQQYLGDGVAEGLSRALTVIEGLNGAARRSSFGLSGKGASMKEITWKRSTM
jgi:TolB-like protein